MTRQALIAWAAIFAIGCAGRQHTFDGDPWLELRSEHFVVRSQANAKDANSAIQQLERVRAALLLSSWHGTTLPSERTSLVLLDDEAAMRELFPRGLQGVATQDPFGDLLLIANAELPPAELPVLKHELAHAINHSFLLRAPRWLDEGLASYLETLELTNDALVIGGLNQLRLRDLRTIKSFEFEKVLNAGPEIYLASARESADFYARSWLLVHMLINQHLAQFNDYLDRMARAEDPVAAFAAAFPGSNPQSLNEEANDYLTRGQFVRRSIPLPSTLAEVASRAMSAPEILEEKAQLELVAGTSFGLPNGKARAAADALAALAADPGLPIAAALWGQNSGASPEARAEKGRAIVAARPDDARGWLFLAGALRDEARAKDNNVITVRDAKTSPVDEERVRAVERAYALAPASPHALDELAEVRLEQGKPGEALSLAREAAKRAPGRPEPLDMLATTLSASGACDSSAKMERRVLEVLPDSAGPEVAEQIRGRVDALLSHCKQNERAKAQAEAHNKGPGPRQCANSGPKLPKISLKHDEEIHLRYTVATDGSIAGLTSDSAAPAPLIKAFVDYVQSCKFQPRQPAAAEPGDPPEEPMQMEESYRVNKNR